MPDTHVCTLLLAAGAARRYGALKQLAHIDGVSLVRRAALAALGSGTPLLVVTGAQAAAVEAELRDLPLTLLHNTQWAEGMGRSLACGACALMAQTDPPAVLVQLADQVLIGTDELRLLLREHAAHPEAIIAADHGVTLGPPCLFPAGDLPLLAQLGGDRGARALLQAHAGRLRRIAMPQARFDIDTPEDLQHLMRRQAGEP